MDSIDDTKGDGVLRTGQGRVSRFECRECEIVCQQVVSPWHCLRSRCRYVYAFEGDETTYFGCLCKVFSPELDLAAFTETNGRRGRGSDPYGPLRVIRTPRAECRVWIERAYETVNAGLACCNPGFLRGPIRRV
ncbi:MAG: hypothetical protein JW990_09250 [Thermoleophilia bacterium]|nr:hypothetical protein [Thermoleophilia bacterium]